jgi:hypothetical protein
MEDEVRWTLRLPQRLRDAIKRLADRDHRSMNGQMVAALEEYVKRQERRGQA